MNGRESEELFSTVIIAGSGHESVGMALIEAKTRLHGRFIVAVELVGDITQESLVRVRE